MKKVILIEFKLDNLEKQCSIFNNGLNPILPEFNDSYEVIGEINISSELKIDDTFVFRMNNENRQVKIVSSEIIYTTNNNLDIYLVWDIDSVERFEQKIKDQQLAQFSLQLGQHTHTYSNPIDINKGISNTVSNFRRDIVGGRIDIDYKSFDRKNKINSILD